MPLRYDIYSGGSYSASPYNNIINNVKPQELTSSNALDASSVKLNIPELKINKTKKSGSSNISKLLGKASVNSNITNGIAAISSFLPTANKTVNEIDATVDGIRTSANNYMITSGNPVLMGVGTVNTLIDKAGGYTDASQGLGTTNDVLNSISSAVLPGAGWLTGKTDSYDPNQRVSVSSGFTGLASNQEKVKSNSGAKFLFGKSKANSLIQEQKRKETLASGILKTSDKLFNQEVALPSKNLNYTSGLRFGQTGMKVPDNIGDIKRILKSDRTEIKFNNFIKSLPTNLRDTSDYDLRTLSKYYKSFNDLKKDKYAEFDPEDKLYHLKSAIEVPDSDEILILKKKTHPSYNKELEWFENSTDADFNKNNYEIVDDKDRPGYTKYIKKFQDGGKMNVIPDGKLHAHKHELNLIDGLEDVTKKGIPVISYNEGGEVVQTAEIEKEEIIFTKEVTDKLEELKKLGTVEAAIEAGKLLTKEILENTKDLANIISES